MKNVLIKDPEALKKKIAIIKADGAEELHIVSDFDRSLTKGKAEGQKIHTAIAQIRQGGYLTPDYAPKAFALFDKYHAYEISEDLSLQEKNAKMLEWWSTHIKLLVDSGMNKNVIDDIIKKKAIKLREGTLHFLDIIHKYNIPLLIFSSALGDFITELLKSENSLFDNIHIVSNFFDFNEDGTIKGYKSDIIHVFNKNEFQVKKTDYYENIKKRKNVILIGDSLGDIHMSEGIPHDEIIRIGFLNFDVEKNKKSYMDTFDVVITNDGPMDYIIDLIKEICG